jgi:hypothetical protein
MGTHAMQFTTKTDTLIYLNLPTPTLQLTTTTNRQETIPLAKLKPHGKDGSGDKILKLAGDEEIVAVISG